LKTAIAAKEKEIANSITSTDEQLTTLDSAFKHQHHAGVESGNSSATEYTRGDEAGMLRTMRERRAILHMLLQLLQNLKIKAEKLAEGDREQSIQVKFGNNNSGIQRAVNNGNITGLMFGVRKQ
jgi:hypothetical protein